jgi:hypothetical protein
MAINPPSLNGNMLVCEGIFSQKKKAPPQGTGYRIAFLCASNLMSLSLVSFSQTSWQSPKSHPPQSQAALQ